jgi:serpin B
MMKVLLAAIMLAALTAGAASGAEKLEAVVAGQNELAFGLFQRLGEDRGNLFFSPTSIWTALAMTYGGARGQTAQEMAAALHFPADLKTLHAGNHSLLQAMATDDSLATRLAVANRLWPATGLALKAPFLNLCRRNYGAPPEQLDFAREPELARQSINRWVARNTMDMIQELLQQGDIGPTTELVLTNAIYFKGTWQTAFDPGRTRPWPFHVSDQRKVQADFMARDGEFSHAREAGAHILELPYADSDLAMLVVLPDSRDDLAKLEKNLTPAVVQRWAAALKTGPLSVLLPRFELTWRQEMVPTLQEMGMRLAFTGQADFSGLAETSLFIDKVIHEARVRVDEEGTEAAAATAVLMKRGAPPESFVANHPFLVLIRDTRTGAIVFMGRVSDPSAGN